MWSGIINVTNRQTDRQTDGRTDAIRWQYRSIAIAWSGKNGTSRGHVWWSYSHWPQSYSLKYAEFCAKFGILASPPQKNWGGAPNITYKGLPSLHNLAKFRGDRPRGFGDFAPKPFSPKLFRGGPQNLGLPMSKCPHFQSYVKVSRRSAQASRRYSAAKWKKKPQQNYHSGRPKNVRKTLTRKYF